MKNKNKQLVLFSIIAAVLINFSVFKPVSALNITKEKSSNNSTLYVYNSACQPNADKLPEKFPCDSSTTNCVSYSTAVSSGKADYNKIDKFYDKGGNYNWLFSDRGIIIPNQIKNQKKTNLIYIYWHGIGWNHHNPETMCDGSMDAQLCNSASKTNAVIFAPHTLNTGSRSAVLKSDEMKCFIDEALGFLKSSGIDYADAKFIVAGHSGGGNYVEKFVKAGYTAGIPIIASLFLEASYGGGDSAGAWSTNLAGYSNSGKVFIYYLKDTPAGGSGTKAGALETYKKYPAKTKVLEIKGLVHYQVASYCFADHLTANNCQGKGSAPTGITNSFEKIDIGEAAGAAPPTTPTTPAIAGPTGQTVDEIQQMISRPKLSIHIPGLNFSQEPKAVEEDEGIYLYIPFIGEYLAAFYKWAVVAISILAVVRLMYAGFGWLMSGGSAEKITAAKKQITSAIIGLLIAVGSYTLLYTINPALVEFKNLKVAYVVREALEEDESKIERTVDTPVSSETTFASVGQCFPIKNSNSLGPNKQNNPKGISWNWGAVRDDGDRCHAGIDIYTKSPGQIVAIEDGEVTLAMNKFATCKDGWGGPGQGGKILIYHPKLNITINYGEIDIESIKLKTGDKTIKKGQLLGIASHCGMLHMEVYSGRQFKNQSWHPPIGEKVLYPPENMCATDFLSTKPPELMDPTNLVKGIEDKYCGT